jgi:hypothetical protein
MWFFAALVPWKTQTWEFKRSRDIGIPSPFFKVANLGWGKALLVPLFEKTLQLADSLKWKQRTTTRHRLQSGSTKWKATEVIRTP